MPMPTRPRSETHLTPTASVLRKPTMSRLFKRSYTNLSGKESTSASRQASAYSSATSLGLVPGNSEDLGLVVAPIIARSSKDGRAGKKKLCIAYGTRALELLEKISDMTDVLAPMKIICGATLNVLKTVEAMDSNKEGWKTLLQTIHHHHTIFTEQLESIDQDEEISSLDPRLQASIRAYSMNLQLILVAAMQESGTVRDQAYEDTKIQKLIRFVNEYRSVDAKASVINGYTKKLEDAMKEFQASIALRTAITVDRTATTVDRTADTVGHIRDDLQQILSLRSGSTLTVMSELKPPPTVVQDFVGRQDILDAMRLTHIDNRSTQLRTPAITVLYGLGGSGKTQIALKFASEIEKRYPNKRVYFLNASSEDTLKADLETVIRSSEPEQPSGSDQDALTWLATKFKDWVMILDNADDPSVQIFKYIPKCTHGDVIVTTRNSNHKSLARHSSHSVEGLSVENAIDLILSISDYEDVEANREIARPIVIRLGCMPLAIAQAGGYIYVNECLSTYLDMYEKNQADFLESQETELPQDYSFTVATTIRMSLEKLPSEAQELMQLLAHLDYTSISYKIIEKSANRQFCSVIRTKEADMDTKTPELAATLMSIFCSNGEWSEFVFGELVKPCLQYSILRQTKQGDSKFYSMHVLVQSYLQTHRDHIRGHRPSLLSIRLLGSSTTDGRPYEHLAINRQLAPHVKLIQPEDVTESGDHLGFGQVLEDAGDFRLSIIHRQRCVEKCLASRGAEHEDTLNAQRCLARSYTQTGDYRKALEMEEDLLRIRRRVNGSEHPETLDIMYLLAWSYYGIGRRQEALKLREEVLELRKKVLGPEHPDTLTSMNNLATSYYAAGQLQEALKNREEVLALQKKVLGPEHPYTLMSMNNLSNSYHDTGRLQEALKLREEAFDLQKRILGPESPDTLAVMSNLASSYHATGQLQDALKLREEVLEARKRILGPEHPDTLASMNNLSISYNAVGRLQEVSKISEETLELRKRILGPDHPDTCSSMRNLALSYDAAGKLHEALKLREEVLEVRKRVLGPEHIDTLTSMNDLTSSYNATGRLQDALKLQEEALELFKRVCGPDSQDTLSAMSNLAIYYEGSGRLQDSLKLREEVLELQKKILGPEHPDTLISMSNLSISYNNDGRQQEAMTLSEEVLELRRKVLRPDHPDTVTSMRNLAILYNATGRSQEALKLREEILEVRKRVAGPEHPDTLTSMNDLAVSYYSTGQLEEASKVWEELLELQKRLLGPEHPDTLATLQVLPLLHNEIPSSQNTLAAPEEIPASQGSGPPPPPDLPVVPSSQNILAALEEMPGSQSSSAPPPADRPVVPSSQSILASLEEIPASQCSSATEIPSFQNILAAPEEIPASQSSSARAPVDRPVVPLGPHLFS